MTCPLFCCYLPILDKKLTINDKMLLTKIKMSAIVRLTINDKSLMFAVLILARVMK